MSIISVQPIRTGYTCNLQYNTPSETTDIWQVRSDRKDENQLLVATASGLPLLGTFYSRASVTSETLLLVSKNASQPNPQRADLWQVVCRYSDQWLFDRRGHGKSKTLASSGKPIPTENPLEFRDEVEITTAQFQRPIDKALFKGFYDDHYGHVADDLTGSIFTFGTTQALTNSSGDPFEPQPTRDDSRLIIRVTQYRENPPSGPPVDCVNSDTLTITKTYLGYTQTFAAGTIKLQSCNSSSMFHNGIAFWKVVWELHYAPAPRGWGEFYLDRGWPLIKSGDPNPAGGTFSLADVEKSFTKTYVPKNPDGTSLMTVPPPLNGKGQLNRNSSGVWQTPVVLLWYPYETAAMSGLAI